MSGCDWLRATEQLVKSNDDDTSNFGQSLGFAPPSMTRNDDGY